MRIALLEDDPAQAELITMWLRENGHDCNHFETGADFLQSMARDSFDLAVLDWGLPDMDGDQVLTQLRENLDWRIPVLFITSRDQEADVVQALQKGADDYMSKPVKRAETMARISALLRRAHGDPNESKLFHFPPYDFDVALQQVTRDSEIIELTRKEFELALFLFRNHGRLLSRGHILQSVWGTKPDLNTRTVDTHVSRIRSKLNLTPATGWRLSAVYQHGYRLEELGTHES